MDVLPISCFFSLLLLAAFFRHFAFFQELHQLLIIRINKHLHKILEGVLKKKVERRYFLLTQAARLK